MKNGKSHLSYRLHQLAHLGLPDQIFIPALLQELHHEISSISNTFCWQDDNEKLCNIYDEMSNNDVIQKFIHSMSTNGSNKYTHTTNWINQLDNPTTTLDYYGQCGFVGEFYKTTLVPMGYFNTCFVPIFHPETKKRLGILMIHRSRHDKEFNQYEYQYLERVASIIAYGLLQASNKQANTIDGWDQGLLIVDQKGNLQHSCAMGEKLLSLASSSFFDGSFAGSVNDLRVFKGLERLVNDLLKTNNHKPHTKNPTLSTSNAWGEFKLRGFLIKDKVGKRTPRIGLNIRWQEPFVLKLFHRIKTLDLTPRQETVGLLYAAGDPYQEIADKLRLSLYTVKEHVRNISNRIDIRSRADLIQLLLCDNPSAF
jgi:DNA-binding CsgD family transcriptional regulator